MGSTTLFAAITDPDEPDMSMELGNPFAQIDVLLSHNVSLVIIGGYAVIYHGYVRSTEDVDIIFERNGENELRLFAALSELDAFWIGEELDPETGIELTFPVTPGYVAKTHLMMLGTRFGYLDVFDFVPGLPAAHVSELIRTAELNTGRPFVSLDWLKRMKQVSNRPKDRDDFQQLP